MWKNQLKLASKVLRRHKENHRFRDENGGFSYFLRQFGNVPLSILGQFWANARKNRISGPYQADNAWLYLCLFSQQHISDALRCLCFVFLYDVGIEVFRCACTGVS